MSQAIARLSKINLDHTDNLFGGAFRLLIAGVGIHHDRHSPHFHGFYYHVTGHGGDYLGRVPNYMAQSLICHLRRQYRLEPQYPWKERFGGHVFTYGYDNLIPWEENEALQEKFWNNPLEIV